MKPLILVSNDDGYLAPGLRTLWQALDAEYETFVVAPARPRSWIGKALSNPGGLTVSEAIVEGKSVHVVNDGTPADCVNVGLYHLIPQPPAFVITGINIGANFTASLIMASGTLGAALEGALQGIPSFSVSLDLDDATEHAVHTGAPEHFLDLFRPAAECTAQFLREWFARPHPPRALVTNLVLPQQPRDPFAFMECAPMPYVYGSIFEWRGDGYYNRRRGFVGEPPAPPEGTDVWAVRQGLGAYTCFTGTLETTHAHS